MPGPRKPVIYEMDPRKLQYYKLQLTVARLHDGTAEALMPDANAAPSSQSVGLSLVRLAVKGVDHALHSKVETEKEEMKLLLSEGGELKKYYYLIYPADPT